MLLEAATNDLYQYGAIGICLAIAYLFIHKLIKDHRKEREEWKKTTERQFEIMNENSNKQTSALTELSTLIKTLKK